MFPIRITGNDGVVVIDGEANFPGAAPGGAYVQNTDPGSVGAGALWLDTAAIAGTSMLPLLVRNAADSAWIPTGLVRYVGGFLRGIVTIADDGGIAIESYDGTGTLVSYILIGNASFTFSPPIGIPSTFNGDISATGALDAQSLGPTPAYVTVQAMPPAGPYQTPLVMDTTAVTGGLYGWDGSAYQGPLVV